MERTKDATLLDCLGIKIDQPSIFPSIASRLIHILFSGQAATFHPSSELHSRYFFHSACFTKAWRGLWPQWEALVSQSCLTPCNSVDYSSRGSSVHGILQARILEWVAIPFSRRSSWSRDQTQISCIADRFFTIWATREAPNVHLLFGSGRS